MVEPPPDPWSKRDLVRGEPSAVARFELGWRLCLGSLGLVLVQALLRPVVVSLGGPQLDPTPLPLVLAVILALVGLSRLLSARSDVPGTRAKTILGTLCALPALAVALFLLLVLLYFATNPSAVVIPPISSG